MQIFFALPLAYIRKNVYLCAEFGAETKTITQNMRKTFFLFIALLCATAQFIGAEGTPVMRFVPVAGAESEVALNTLRKVVFTPDSVVLIAAQDGAQMPLYKYDYQAIVFTESSTPQSLQVTEDGLRESEKFIQDGKLYIRHDNMIYNIMGLKIDD